MDTDTVFYYKSEMSYYSETKQTQSTAILNDLFWLF